MDKKGFRLWYRSFFATTIPSHCSFCPSWEGIPPNGVDLVRQIYHTDPGGKIVFVTGHGEKGMDILRSGVRPFGFIENVWIRMRWFGSIFDI